MDDTPAARCLRFAIDVSNAVLVGWPHADLVGRVALHRSLVEWYTAALEAVEAELRAALPGGDLDPRQVRIDRFSTSPGAPAAVRVTHLPTGLVAQDADESEALRRLAGAVRGAVAESRA